MDLNPTYTAVGTLFVNKPMFLIPKYQRAYAWDARSVEDFIKDLDECFVNRKSNFPISHFFGGFLSVEHSVQGVVRQHEYEIIDGQQRIATFTLLMSCIIKMYKELKVEAGTLKDTNNEYILGSRIENLSERFIQFKQEVQRNIKSIEVLRLSKADSTFYRALILDENPSPSRDSHKRLLDAYQAILKAVRKIVNSPTLVNKMDDLEIIQNVIDSDFTILHMVTGTRSDAFRLFQVINDRGTSLTDGDLLRAKTLEILEGFDSEQNKVEDLWNEILADPPSKTADYLHWIFESYRGQRAPQNALFNEFFNHFFLQHNRLPLTSSDAQQICAQVSNVHMDIIKCRNLVDGQWLYPTQSPVTGWDRNRLSLLVRELNHELSVPLFLAASKLDHRMFSEIVQIVERTYFRYKIICNQHANSLQKIYREELMAIRKDPTTYKVSSIKQKLQNLIKSKSADKIFKSYLEALEYKGSGDGSNKPLKYFLITLEYYYQWYKQGAKGIPTCLDKTRIYDFSGTSIEHIYPQKAKIDGDVFKTDLESLKNRLGNLAILDPVQNSTGSNDNFALKRSIYQASSVLLTEEIATKPSWTQQEIEARKNLLIDIALKVFNP